MKRLIFTLLILFSIPCLSQTIWQYQNSGTSSILQGVYFVDQDYGWIAGANIILHTTDGGNTWVNQPAPPVSIYYVGIFFIDRMNGWACGNDAKIIHTTNGGNTWVSQPHSYTFPNPILYDIYFANADTGWAVGGDHGTYPSFINRRVILYTTNGGNTWSFQLDAQNERPLISAHFISKTEGFAAGEFGDIVHTSDGGNTWTAKTPISSYEPYGIYFADSNNGWVAGEYGGVPHTSSISKTTDGGLTWNTQNFLTDEYFLDIYFVDNLNGWAVGGTPGYITNQHASIMHTTDGGINWQTQNVPTNSALGGVNFVDANSGWAVGVNGIVLTYENPTPVELTSFNANVKGSNINLFWQTATETNNLGFEILRSAQSDNSWEKIGFIEGHGTTTEEHNYSFVDKNPEPGNYSYKLVQIDFDGTRTESKVVNVEINLQPAEYSLMQNYPNPFNPVTTIIYSIPESGIVNIKIYNTLGEKVTSLVNEFKEAGNYKINFDAENLSSGIYFYSLQAGEFNSIKKMILLK